MNILLLFGLIALLAARLHSSKSRKIKEAEVADMVARSKERAALRAYNRSHHIADPHGASLDITTAIQVAGITGKYAMPEEITEEQHRVIDEIFKKGTLTKELI
jgi:hypothetical protein